MIVKRINQGLLKRFSILFLSSLSVSYTAFADPWKFDVAPYLWAINMHGHIQVGPEQVSISQSFSEIMKHFQGGGMLWLNARKDKFGVFANLMYSVLKDDLTPRGIDLVERNKFGIFSGGVSYEVFQHNYANQVSQMALELFGGARYTLNDVRITSERFDLSNNQNWTDPMVGTRLTLDFSKKWQATAAADIGGINKHHSYDLQGYIGYKPVKPLVLKNPVLYLGYRLLYQHYSSGSGLSLFVWNMHISGPVIGVKTSF